MVVHLRARVRARARSCVCACVRVGCEEGAGFEKRGDVDSMSLLRSLGDARGKNGRAVGVCRGDVLRGFCGIPGWCVQGAACRRGGYEERAHLFKGLIFEEILLVQL